MRLREKFPKHMVHDVEELANITREVAPNMADLLTVSLVEVLHQTMSTMNGMSSKYFRRLKERGI